MDNVMDDIIENDIENDIEIAPQPSTSGQIVQKKASLPIQAHDADAVKEVEKSQHEYDEPEMIVFERTEVNDKGRYKERQHYCLKCQKSMCQLARHLTTIHKNEADVAKALALPEKEQKKALKLLVNR